MNDLINTIHVNARNFQHIAKTGKINGTLQAEICRVMIEYHDEQSGRDLSNYTLPELTEHLHCTEALIREFHRKQANSINELFHALKKDERIEYIGGSRSKNLIIGCRYRLTTTPWSKWVRVIGDNGNALVLNNNLFKI